MWGEPGGGLSSEETVGLPSGLEEGTRLKSVFGVSPCVEEAGLCEDSGTVRTLVVCGSKLAEFQGDIF